MWIPVVTIVYCLPQPLQLPVQNMVLSFWILVLSMANSVKPTPSTSTTPDENTVPVIANDDGATVTAVVSLSDDAQPVVIGVDVDEVYGQTHVSAAQGVRIRSNSGPTSR